MEIVDLFDFIMGLFASRSDVIQIQEPVYAWFPLVMGIASAVSAGVGAVKSSQANKRNARQLRAMERDNEAEYLREYYRGALDNEGSKAYLKKLDERMRRSDAAAENALTAQGATHENALAVKQANNEVYSGAVGSLVENEQARKDQVRSDYKEGKRAIAEGQMQQNSNEAATASQLASGVSSAFNAIGSAYSDGTNPLKDLFKGKPVGDGKQ
jgi:hypothetical protein